MTITTIKSTDIVTRKNHN